MIKEFEIKDILEAVDSISNIKKKERNIDEKKNFNIKNDALILNNQVKSHKSEVLVLNEMIE